MFSKKIIGKLSFAFLVLSVVMLMGMSSCSKKVSVEDVTDKNQTDTQQTDTNTNTNDQTTTDNNQSTDVNLNETGVKFLNINLVGGEPPLQKSEGIFYFTKTQHPPEVDTSFKYDTHNGWLIQLDNPSYYGQKIKVQKIKKSGSIYDITVKLESGGESTKPAFGFFEVGIFDMPTSAQFRIYNDAGQKLWPKY